MNDLAVIDIVLFIVLILLTIRGFIRGFIREFFSLGAPALGILAGFLLNKNGAEFLRTRYFANIRAIPEILAFIAIFLIVFIVCKIIQKIVLDVVSGMNLTTIDKVLGCIFGLVEGFLAAALVIFIIKIQPLFNSSEFLTESIFGRIILPLISPKEAIQNSAALLFPYIFKLG